MDNQKEPVIAKVVLTGGPCAGKTTAMSWLQNEFTNRGYKVLFVPEAASAIIIGGIKPTDVPVVDFQSNIFRTQMLYEEIFERLAKHTGADKVLIVCDRGVLDNKAYMSDTQFDEVCRVLGKEEVQLRDNYDAVFHLVTAANGAKESYEANKANNPARFETAEQAIALDDKLINAWTGHPHLRVIKNEGSFENKMKALIHEVASFLGEPEPFEIERKYLIKMPDIGQLIKAGMNCQKVEIVQTYLEDDIEGEEHRIRQRGQNGSYIYYETRKIGGPGLVRTEIERRLTKDEYLNLMMQADTKRRQIRKDRYCLMDDGMYFEIDIYPFWKNQAIVEVELSDESQEVKFPDFIKIIREVTGVEEYSNYALSGNIPKEVD